MKSPIHNLITFAELFYNGPPNISPESISIVGVEPTYIGDGPTLKVTLQLDEHRMEALFTRSGTGGLEYQLPHRSIGGPASAPAVSIDATALGIIFEWMEILVPKAEPFGLDKQTGAIYGYHSRERWEPHSRESIMGRFNSGQFIWRNP